MPEASKPARFVKARTFTRSLPRRLNFVLSVGSDGYDNRVTWEVIGYEEVAVPFGTFQSAQKVLATFYDEGQVDENLLPSYLWFDENLGLLREEIIDSGEAIALLNYQPPPSGPYATHLTQMERKLGGFSWKRLHIPGANMVSNKTAVDETAWSSLKHRYR